MTSDLAYPSRLSRPWAAHTGGRTCRSGPWPRSRKVRNGSSAGLIVLTLVLGLSGCAVSEKRRQAEAVVDESTTSPEIHADLIRRMIDQEQYYAALAHVQAQIAQSGSTPELRLLEAESRRRLGQTEQAQALYRELLKTQFVADAYHGLGLISASGNLSTAIWQLQQAVQRRPADARMRNDLGYALMMARRYSEALPEISTAVELEARTGSERARNNLVVLMLLTGDEAAVRRVAEQSAMSPETLARLRSQAQSLRAVPAPKSATPQRG